MRSGGRVETRSPGQANQQHNFPCRPPWHDLLSCKGAHSCRSVGVTSWDTSRQPAHPHKRLHRSSKISPCLESSSRHAWNPAAALISQRDKRWQHFGYNTAPYTSKHLRFCFKHVCSHDGTNLSCFLKHNSLEPAFLHISRLHICMFREDDQGFYMIHIPLMRRPHQNIHL